MRSVYLIWLAKDDFTLLKAQLRIYRDNNLTSQQDIPISQAKSIAITEPISVEEEEITYESVTVPVGTFVNCWKVTIQGGTIWLHESVPIWGIVKAVSYTDGETVVP